MSDFMQLGCLRVLAEWRNPVIDTLMLLVTRLGEEVLFMAVALAFFWCGRKMQGYFLLITGFFGTVANQALKLFMAVPRPWVLDPTFEPIAAAKPAATGFSFPSGHTQTATTLYGGIAYTERKGWARILGIFIVLLVAFSRLWLGVHTLSDVLTSLVLGVFLVLLLGPLFTAAERRPRILYIISFVMIGVSLLNVVYASLAGGDFTGAEALENLREARKNAWSLFGASAGVPIILYLDAHYIRFDGRARPLVQLAKVVIGLALLLLLKEGLSLLLDLLPGDFAFRHGIRYFIVVLFAGVAYPFAFTRLLKK